MLINKITHGYVVQTYNTVTKEFVHQEFIANDEYECETTAGEAVDFDSFGIPPEDLYLPYEMVQPTAQQNVDTLDSIEITDMMDQYKKFSPPSYNEG